ncbi:MAG: DUF1573 domain-containing protein [Lentisphaeria bacterium]|jgi:hypothetical protein|nr:DUF1573 domain-containing protein [Lentisphaeria bacterium]
MRLPVILAFSLLLPVVDVQSQTLTIDEPTFDFGEINDINLVYKTVTLTNTGDAELEIKRVKGTCGCTTGKLEKKTLEPGESTSLTIQFLPATYDGLISKAIKIASNDPDSKVSTITFTATVWPFLQVTPKIIELEFDAEAGGYTGTTRVVELRNMGEKSLKLKTIDQKGMPLEIEGEMDVVFEPGDARNYTIGIAKPEEIPVDTRPLRTFAILRVELQTDKGRMVSSKNVKFRFPRKR